MGPGESCERACARMEVGERPARQGQWCWGMGTPGRSPLPRPRRSPGRLAMFEKLVASGSYNFILIFNLNLILGPGAIIILIINFILWSIFHSSASQNALEIVIVTKLNNTSELSAARQQ